MGTSSVTELDVEGKEIVAGVGQLYRPFGEDRLTVMDVGHRRPRVLWDGGWRRAELAPAFDALRARARLFRLGEFDTMHATEWHLAWTIDGGEFSLWDRRGRRVWADDRWLHRRGHRPVSFDDVETVEATLSRGWLTRGVAVGLSSGERLSIASATEPMTTLDPTYDYMDLVADASWASALTKGLAAALGVPADCTAYD